MTEQQEEDDKMLTANRIQQFLNSARDWDVLWRGEMTSELSVPHRLATNEKSAWFELDLPGYEREELELEVEGNELLISVCRKEEQAGTNWKVRERHSPPTDYRFEFPFRIDAERTEVSYENGVLRIEIQKPETDQPKKLVVK